MPSIGKGTFVLLSAEFEQTSTCFTALGQPGKRAETVADEAVNQLLSFLETDGAVDPFLADQLLLPLAFASGVSEYKTSQVTDHLITNAEVIRHFLPCQITITGKVGQPGNIYVKP